MLTWIRKRAFLSWRTGIYVSFPGRYLLIPYLRLFHLTSISQENMLVILASHTQSAKMPKVVQLRSCGEKPLKKQKSPKWAFTNVFFEDTDVLYIYIYVIYIYIVYILPGAETHGLVLKKKGFRLKAQLFLKFLIAFICWQNPPFFEVHFSCLYW